VHWEGNFTLVDKEIGAEKTYRECFEEMRANGANSSRSESKALWYQLPLVAIASLEEDDNVGRLGVVEASHLHQAKANNPAKTIYFTKGQLLLLDPLTFQFGQSYVRTHLRIHFYVNNPFFLRCVQEMDRTVETITGVKDDFDSSPILKQTRFQDHAIAKRWGKRDQKRGHDNSSSSKKVKTSE